MRKTNLNIEGNTKNILIDRGHLIKISYKSELNIK